MIVGPGGAGKSWLAKRIAERTGLPLIHLDREYWRPGWIETPKPAWKARVAEIVARERWVMDGNYGGTLALRMARADTIVFLDVSRWASLAGVLSRRVRANQREDMTDGCPERVNLTFLRWLWRYHDHHRPGVLEQIGAYAHGRTVIVLRDRPAITAFANAA
jgi:adenylate kinase family enzyme